MNRRTCLTLFILTLIGGTLWRAFAGNDVPTLPDGTPNGVPDVIVATSWSALLLGLFAQFFGNRTAIAAACAGAVHLAHVYGPSIWQFLQDNNGLLGVIQIVLRGKRAATGALKFAQVAAPIPTATASGPAPLVPQPVVMLLLLLALTLPLRAATTNAVPLLDTSGQLRPTPTAVAGASTTNSTQNQLVVAGKSFAADFKSLSLTNGFGVEPFALYHKGDYGGGLLITTVNTNGLNLALGLAAIREKDATSGRRGWNFYKANASVSLNGKIKVPIIDLTLDGYLMTGMAANIKDLNTVYSETDAGASYTFHLAPKLNLKLGGGMGYLSKWSGPFYNAQAAFLYRPAGW